MSHDSLMLALDIGKVYRTYSSDVQRVLSWFMPIQPKEEAWVLRHVSFEVKRGEAVGIVGQNGAGKSTLLKIITGTLPPSEGDLMVQGKVAAILELGMGFNGELSGRQNAFHAAALLGHDEATILRVMPEIEAFAEIGEYFDQPMRTYSSGMQMRVAFAVATAIRPDLLIVDEALSVGDAYFQHKSFDRIRQFQRMGTALLIVSHDKEAILRLCDRVVLLDQGRVVEDGEPKQVMDFYNALIADRQNQQIKQWRLNDDQLQTSSGSGEAKVVAAGLFLATGQQVEQIAVGDQVVLRLDIEVSQPLSELVVGYMIKNRLGQTIFGTNTWHTEQMLTDLQPGQTWRFEAEFDLNLGPGHYAISTALHTNSTHVEKNYHWLDYAVVFEVVNPYQPFFIGSSWMMPRIHLEARPQLESESQDTDSTPVSADTAASLSSTSSLSPSPSKNL